MTVSERMKDRFLPESTPPLGGSVSPMVCWSPGSQAPLPSSVFNYLAWTASNCLPQEWILKPQKPTSVLSHLKWWHSALIWTPTTLTSNLGFKACLRSFRLIRTEEGFWDTRVVGDSYRCLLFLNPQIPPPERIIGQQHLHRWRHFDLKNLGYEYLSVSVYKKKRQ